MKRYFKSSISAMAMSALVMGGVAATVSLSAVPAFSKSENANNGNGGNRGGNRGGRENGNRGALTSSMGALNAAHANAMALANASENSRVGMIALYKAAVMASADAEADLEWFKANCEAPVEEDIVNECTALLEAASVEAGDPDYYNRYIAISGDEIEGLDELENEALELAANKETNDDVIEALWDLLDLEGFEPTEEVE